MSADRQRLVGAIRRMVKSDPEVRKLLDGARNKGDQAGSSASASSNGEESRLCCDGSTGPVNAGVTQSDPDSGGQDASGGLDASDPARLTMGAGSLTGLTDCSTGEPICFDGNEWALPVGWESPTEPPVDEGYEEGFYWLIQGTGLGDIYGASPQEAADNVAVAGGDADPYCAVDEDGTWILYDSALGPECGRRTGLAIVKQACNGSQESYCTEVPYEDAWPEDGCVNLAIKNGSIVSSKYDPENTGAYSSPMAEIELCDGSGNSVKIAPSADGGWKSVNGTTGEDGYLYNAQGEQIAHIDGAEYSDPNI